MRRRYDTLSFSFLRFVARIVARCVEAGTPLSFCGEDAGRPLDALALAAIGLRELSMRPASIGPVKELILRADLGEVSEILDDGYRRGVERIRPLLMDYLSQLPRLDQAEQA